MFPPQPEEQVQGHEEEEEEEEEREGGNEWVFGKPLDIPNMHPYIHSYICIKWNKLVRAKALLLCRPLSSMTSTALPHCQPRAS